jgi:hypothetical protein
LHLSDCYYSYKEREEHDIAKEFPSVPVVGEVIPINAGDVERALTYWENDAIVRLFGVPIGMRNIYCGKEQVRGWLTELVAQHHQMQAKVIKVQGNTVTTRTQIWDDLTRRLGITPVEAIEVYIVEGGKITSLTRMISPESKIRLQAALRKEKIK